MEMKRMSMVRVTILLKYNFDLNREKEKKRDTNQLQRALAAAKYF